MVDPVRNRRILLGAAPLVLFSLATCSVYDESLLEGAAPGAPVDPGKTSKCEHATYPDPPSGKGLGGDIEVVGAMQLLSFGDPHAVDLDLPHHTEIGFDLDMTCTGQGEGSSCVLPDFAKDVDKTDGKAGRDNAVGALITEIQNYIPQFGSQTFNEMAEEGKVSILFRIRGYNGLPDDDQVEASLFVGAPYDSFTDGAKPQWDGTDVWPVASDSLSDGHSVDKPLYLDARAYVRDGTLVATLPEVSIRLPNGLLPGNAGEIMMKLVGAFIAGKLVEVDTAAGKAWELQDVHLGGRWPTDDLVKQMAQFPAPPYPFKEPLCMDSAAYEIFRRMLCSHTDIFAGVGGPTSICNAISFGLYLQTRPAKLGEVVQIEPPATDRCPAETDPAQDACGQPIPVFD